jgi:competence protein ComEC
MRKALGHLGLVILSVILLILSEASLKEQDIRGVYFLDVGQGDSIYIRTPMNFDFLVDTGKNSAVVYELQKILPRFDKYIDFIFLTHADKDHIGGIKYLLEKYSVGGIGVFKEKEDDPLFVEIIDKAKKINIPIYELSAGDEMKISDQENLNLKILYPTLKVESTEDNKKSLVIDLTYGESKILLMGDADKEVERILMYLYPDLDTEILKVGHHGSKSSTDIEFLKKISPETGVLSYGKNSYGHPAEEVVSNLQSENINVLSTKEKGTIRFLWNGQRLVLQN